MVRKKSMNDFIENLDAIEEENGFSETAEKNGQILESFSFASTKER